MLPLRPPLWKWIALCVVFALIVMAGVLLRWPWYGLAAAALVQFATLCTWIFRPDGKP